MSVVSIPIVNKNYPMGCEDGQESRLIELGRMVDARAREILDKIGPLPENSLLATIFIPSPHFKDIILSFSDIVKDFILF